MNSYINQVKEAFKNWKTALLVLIFTVARIIYGFAWLKSGWGKLVWFSDGKLNSAGKIGALIKNLAGPEVKSFDPLLINKAWAWVASNIFLGLPEATDALVVIFEILVGVLMILGFRIFWAAIIAMFMNVQFLAGASFNNFGYIWTNIAMMQFHKYAELLGIGGFISSRKNQKLV